MFGLMLSIFILCCIYFAMTFLYFTVLFLQVASQGISTHITIPWTHFISLIIVIMSTVASAIYCFGGVR